MTTDGPWRRRLLSFAGLAAAVALAMVVLTPSRPAHNLGGADPSATRLSPAEEYA